jgi:hypothetical protein
MTPLPVLELPRHLVPEPFEGKAGDEAEDRVELHLA